VTDPPHDPDRLAEIKAQCERLALLNLTPPADVRWLVAEVERLRGLLARLEWAGCYLDSDEPRWAACPACGAENPSYGTTSDTPGQHDPDGCWLADELNPERETTRPGPREG
jgi:hypothetical protein